MKIKQYNKNLDFIKNEFKGNPLYKNRYSNNGLPKKSHIYKTVKWLLYKNPQKEDAKKYRSSMTVNNINNITDNSIYWLGHSSFFICINNKRILIDPVLFNIIGFKRQTALPLKISQLTNINYVLISHDHYDHFDIKSIKKIYANNDFKALVPLGVGNILKKHIKNINYEEAGWYQKFNINDMNISFLPADHWCRRTFFDQNKRLWGSFIIKTDNISIFFAGDTAFNKDMFQEIHSTVGDIDICILPIGCYSPSFMMRDHHMNPEEAGMAFNILNGKFFIPMHFGTFALSDEPVIEPMKRLKKVIDNDKIVELNIGDKFPIK